MTKDQMVGALVAGSKQIEGILEAKFGARGKGLHSKALSVQEHLGAALLKKIQFVATIRNKAVHEAQFSDIPFEAWSRSKDQVLAALEALDPIDRSSAAAQQPSFAATSSRSVHAGNRARRSTRQGGAGSLFTVVVVLVVLGFVSLSILRSVRGSQARSTERPADATSPAASGASLSSPASEVPLWSVQHRAHRVQDFPWREEQAAYVAAGETGPLPAETMWQRTSDLRTTKRNGRAALQMDIQLGGGKTTGSVFFPLRDNFGHLKVSATRLEVEIPSKKIPPGVIHGTAHTEPGNFGGDLFECRREVADGCGAWADKGVRYFGLSTVSIANAIKVVR